MAVERTDPPIRVAGYGEAPEGGTTFDLRTPLLQQGITTDWRAKTEHLSIAVKVYADGGENRMHAHNYEDHSFVVLAGQATFHVGTDENVKVLNKWEGIVLPRDTEYWFQSTPSEGNLVMLRIAARIPGIIPAPLDKSFFPERIEMPGRFFPDDCR
jgi:quercetin dioxygenase-like cupin family protein